MESQLVVLSHRSTYTPAETIAVINEYLSYIHFMRDEKDLLFDSMRNDFPFGSYEVIKITYGDKFLTPNDFAYLGEAHTINSYYPK